MLDHPSCNLLHVRPRQRAAVVSAIFVAGKITEASASRAGTTLQVFARASPEPTRKLECQVTVLDSSTVRLLMKNNKLRERKSR